MIKFSPTDVDKELAYRAHCGTSMVPEKRAEQEVAAYLKHMEVVAELFGQWATDDNRDEMAADLGQYRAGYVQRLHAYWAAHSRVMSTMITGPANFPARTNEKRCDTADRRRDEWLAWDKKTRDRLRRKYDPVQAARAPVRSGDPEAVQKLRAKLERAQAFQETMKAANRICRSKLTDEEKAEQLAALDGVTAESARQLLEPDYMDRIGFPSYALTNNSAEIRRIKKRIEQLQAETERRENTPDEYEIGGVRIVENADLNRLQICFEDKPPREVRDRLKARGFRWSPRNVAWQRLLNDAARQAAREVLAA